MGKVTMSEKRILFTNWAGKAWETVCQKWDFEKVALKIGMSLAIDDSNKDQIDLEGLGRVQFSRADVDPEDTPLDYGVDDSPGIPWRLAEDFSDNAEGFVDAFNNTAMEGDLDPAADLQKALELESAAVKAIEEGDMAGDDDSRDGLDDDHDTDSDSDEDEEAFTLESEFKMPRTLAELVQASLAGGGHGDGEEHGFDLSFLTSAAVHDDAGFDLGFLADEPTEQQSRVTVDSRPERDPDWEGLQEDIGPGRRILRDCPEIGNNLIGREIFYRSDTLDCWRVGRVALKGDGGRSLRYGWNFKVRFEGKPERCLLLAETYGANDESRWCLLND
jgi:hypothetical protein